MRVRIAPLASERLLDPLERLFRNRANRVTAMPDPCHTTCHSDRLITSDHLLMTLPYDKHMTTMTKGGEGVYDNRSYS
jgi:hypothetical protein